MPDEIAWTEAVRQALLEQAAAAAPRECAALLGGRRAGAAVTVTEVLALPNVARGEDAFEVPPPAFLAAEAQLRARGARFVGFAHSHPGGSCAPSARDRAELWPDCVQVITDGVRAQAWWATPDRALRPLPLEVAEAGR